jgi:hypothetical protein
VLSIDRRVARGFGEFLLSRMDSLFDEYSGKAGLGALGDANSAAAQSGKRVARLR